MQAVEISGDIFVLKIIFALLTTRKAAWYIILVLSVCLNVCQTITFESLDIGSSYLHMRYISIHYGSNSYMKVIGSRSRSRAEKVEKSLFPQCKTSIGNNSRSAKHRAAMFA